MKFFYKKCIFSLVILCFGCTSQAKNMADATFCEQIHTFSKGIEIGGRRSIIFSIENGAGIFPVKICKPSMDDEKSLQLCKWLSINSSFEFMASNITRVIACITNSENFMGKRVRVSELSGKFSVSDPFFDIKNIDIDFEYSFKETLEKSRNYFSITVHGVDNSDD